MRVSTAQWAWGASTHWQLYYTLKGFGKTWFGAISSGTSQLANYVSEKKESVQLRTRRRHSTASGSSSSNTNSSTDDDTRGVLQQRKRKRSLSHSSFTLCRRRSSTSTSQNSENDTLITDEEVNTKLWENEQTTKIQHNCVASCSTNQLASNQPNEDQIFVTKSTHTGGILFGVLDGHGGSGFSEHAKIRLPYYLHSALLDPNTTHESLFTDLLASNEKQTTEWTENLENNNVDTNFHNSAGHIMSYISNPLRQLFGTSVFGDYANQNSNIEISSALKDAFIQLDIDITSELRLAVESNKLDERGASVALSGCCALVAYIIDNEFFVANLGDCRAVLGTLSDTEWSAIQLTHDHTAVGNPAEVKRILAEHPSDERWSCIQYGRLLGRLAPLRALGDIQFKLPLDEQQAIFKGVSKYNPMRSLKTPPYLSAEPEVFNYKIEKNDKFIVLASDGLWDMLSNEEVVEIVASYLEGHKIDILKERAHLFGVANCDEILQDPDAFKDTADENVASFLIRYALGGYDRNNIRALMSLSYPDVRLYRDDITVAVIFLENSENTEFS